MPKHQIDIDVPEGYVVDSVISQHIELASMPPIPASNVRVTFKKKPPQFIEVREYLVYYPGIGYTTESINKSGSYYSPCEVENMPNFIKWIDQDWRKVEI